ncbi:secretion protein HlyD [Tautonia sociabilis]|uniref:Secretion protein HlyD n=2 Tax=Tautonia sociabilis TaxID=2080755 RepID=A0A432MJI0_9BACT|nr:secretion protein HlyD [Tautonia sociabilis]
MLDPPRVDRPDAAPSREAPCPSPTPSPSRRRGPPRRVILAVIALAALGGGSAWFAGLIDVDDLRSRLPWHESGTPGALVLFGNVDIRQVDLGFKVEGRIASLAVDEGDAVSAGDVLATLDRRYFEDELRLAVARRDAQAAALERLEHGSRPEEIAQARALVDQRLAEAELAKAEVRRTASLMERSMSSRQDYDRDRAAARVADAQLESARQALLLAEIGPRIEDIEAARAELEAAEAEVVRARRRLADAELLAPGSGVVLTRAREVGAIVQPGETVFTVTLSRPVWVRTYVAEPDLGLVRPGMAVEVRTDTAPDAPYTGRVGFISPTAEFTPKAVETPELRTRLVYRVRIVVDDPDGGLRQGMPVTVTIPLPEGEET